MSYVQSRRQFMGRSACALATIATTGIASAFNPMLARAEGAPLKVFTFDEFKILEALGDTLVPGASEAGIAHYIDSQLASASPLLMLNYLDFPMSLAAFYQQGLAALDRLANSLHETGFALLSRNGRDELVGAMAAGQADPWDGPPAPLFYFALRADALDVCYGTEAGFAQLDIPYLPHISPSSPW